MLTLEVCWPIRRGRLRARDGYPLFSALCRAGLVFHGQPDTIVLPPDGSIVVRCPGDRAWRLAGSGLESLDVARERVELAPPVVRPLASSRSLRAWCVTIKGKQDDQSLLAGCRDQLGRMGVSGRASVTVGPRRALTVSGAVIVGYGVQIDGLDDAESVRVQARGVGGRTRMGCGGFVPC